MKWALLLTYGLGNAQSLHVYSEFARIDSSGEVAAPARPREILSPAVVRNGFTSFQIVVQVPKGTAYWLYVGQNPDDAVRVTMYREAGKKLEPVELPFQGSSTEILWMDVWTAREAPVRRIKVEPELNVGSDWILYPMEVRVMDATVPDGASNAPLVCGSAPTAAGEVGRARLRNARQDAALATRAPQEGLRRVAACEAADSGDPEWYLRIRDYLFRTH